MVGEKQTAAAPHQMDQAEKHSWVVAVAAEEAEEKKDWRVQPNRRELQEEQRRQGEVVPKHRQEEDL
jgi:predicted acetyltransferase